MAILQCGDAPPALEARFGSYSAMMRRLLDNDQAAIIDVTRGPPPAPGDFGGYLLTGSPAGVYDPLLWIAPLLDFLRAARGRAPIVGICFGHQAMAQAWGGQVEKSDRGWGIGLQRYKVHHRAAWMDDIDAVEIAASHQDQVVLQPPGSHVTLANDFCPLAGLDYGDAISFQCHPEFCAGFGIGLIEQRREAYGALAEPAIASYARPGDAAVVTGWIRRFLAG